MAETPVTPIAVIGMGCRLPGGIDSPAAFWQALLRRDDLVTKVPLDRWDADEYYDPEPGVPGRSVSKWGAFLDDVELAVLDDLVFGSFRRFDDLFLNDGFHDFDDSLGFRLGCNRFTFHLRLRRGL